MAYISFQPETYFQTMLYTGDGTDARALTNDGIVNLQPDLIWIKCRTAVNWHDVTDSSRGVTKSIYPSETSLEVTDANSVQAFSSDGFTVGTQDQVNEDTKTYAEWQWKGNARTTYVNAAGTKDTTVQVNTTAGFSMFTYAGSDVSRTFGHGLGVVPDLVIVKNLSATGSWHCYWKPLGNQGLNWLDDNATASTTSTTWDSTSPTSTVITMNGGASYTGTNRASNNYIAYCFTSIKGYSQIGNYKGTGNIDGTFINLGFRPALVIIKNAGANKNWYMFDSARDPYNLTDRALKPDINDIEADSSDWNALDLLSNGFKLRGGSSGVGDDLNGAYNYVYVAFAKNPFVSSNSIPATAV